MVLNSEFLFQAVIAMLACARLGAIHSVVFGGFAAQELARRIEHAEVSKFIHFIYLLPEKLVLLLQICTIKLFDFFFLATGCGDSVLWS